MLLYSEDESNPMVAGFQDELDSEDDQPIRSTNPVLHADLELSSDDEMEAGKAITTVPPIRDADIDSDVGTGALKSKTHDTSSSHNQSRASVNNRTSRSPSPNRGASQTSKNVTDPVSWSSDGHLKPDCLSDRKQTLQELSMECSRPSESGKPTQPSLNGDVEDLVEDSDEELTNQVTVLGDVEDISEDEVTTSSRLMVNVEETDGKMVSCRKWVPPYTVISR